MTNIKFTGIMPALVTPFDLNGKVKENSVRNIIKRKTTNSCKNARIWRY